MPTGLQCRHQITLKGDTEVDVYNFHVGVNEENEKFCIIGIHNIDVTTLGIFFEATYAITFLHLLHSYVSEHFLIKLSREVEQAGLPDSHFRLPVVITNYAASILIHALETYLKAQAQQFKPNSTWPMIDIVPRYPYLSFAEDPEALKFGPFKSVEYYNGMLAQEVSEGEYEIHFLNSREHWRHFLLSDNSLTNQQVTQIFRDIEVSILPDVSKEEVQKISGYMARLLYYMIRYDEYILKQVSDYELAGWPIAVSEHGRTQN